MLCSLPRGQLYGYSPRPRKGLNRVDQPPIRQGAEASFLVPHAPCLDCSNLRLRHPGPAGNGRFQGSPVGCPPTPQSKHGPPSTFTLDLNRDRPFPSSASGRLQSQKANCWCYATAAAATARCFDIRHPPTTTTLTVFSSLLLLLPPVRAAWRARFGFLHPLIPALETPPDGRSLDCPRST